ncbi:concanavalin A-like lectin/glucanase domain-containing protein [Coniella lustricola]|uniref:chitinase n=1 Tax=Coniella lustricola TaxID=2025994 RepID=A0A2T2ZYL3_9PEZI|nr:concanavalin A-like lectin/glucanase domain-containing protein [Coniella lustricola]
MLSSMRSLALPAGLLLGALQGASAQTSSSCNPTVNTTCPSDPAFGADHTWYFNTSSAPSTDEWTVTASADAITWTDNGANMTVAEKGDSPTLRSEFYIFGGRVEIWLKVAPGQGIISSVMLLSDDLDEIDLEFLGGNGTAAQTNYFGKGTNNYTWESDFEVSGGTLDAFHNYTIDWTNSSLKWYIDGDLVRNLTPEEANNTHSYPQTPMRVYIGPWAGGDSDNAAGTIAWAGGETDYANGPYTMAVQSCRVTDYGMGTAYKYTDQTGDWDSIEMLNTDKNSTAATALTEEPSESISEKFNDLSTGSKAAIFACSGAAALGLLAYAAFYCARQRKRGNMEAKMAAQKMEEERLEMEGYKAAGINPDGFAEAQPVYDAKSGMATREVQVADYSEPNHEKFGAMAMAGAGAMGAAAARPLLRNGASPPGTPNSYNNAHDPYSDSFSPIDNHYGGGVMHHPQSPPMGMPPTAPLPGVPDRSFSNPNAQVHGDGFETQPQRSFSNRTDGNGGDGYWR